jgi:arylsulfatase A-like enzyme
MASKLNPPNPSTEPAALQPAGLLVVTIDRLPAWMLAAYGATWVSTPALDSLAARGVVFDRLIATSPAPDHTLHDLGDQLFAATGGWPAAVVTDDPVVAAGMVAATAGEPAASVRLVEAAAKTEVEENDAETNIARLVDAAIDVIVTGSHQLVWCHIGSLAVAWDAPERYRDRYIDPEDPPPPSGAHVPGFAVDADTDPDRVVGMRQVFAGQITLLDSQLARLFAATRQGTGSECGWAVLVVGVRGLPLGLHGWAGVGGRELPYGELIHLPAVFVDAAGRMAAQRYGGLVVPADLGRTLRDWMDDATGSQGQSPAVDAASPWLGRSLAGLFEIWSVTVRDRVVVTGPDGAAIVTPAWHCLLAAEPTETNAQRDRNHAVRLFAKPDDFFELADVANRCSDVVGPLGDLLERVIAGEDRAVWVATLPAATQG